MGGSEKGPSCMSLYTGKSRVLMGGRMRMNRVYACSCPLAFSNLCFVGVGTGLQLKITLWGLFGNLQQTVIAM